MTNETTGAMERRRAAPLRKVQLNAAGAPASGRLSNTRERDELVADICARVVGGESIRGIFRNRGKSYPSEFRFWQWMREYPQYRETLTLAERLRAHVFAEEIVALADEEPERLADGRVDPAWVQWQNNRVQKRQWSASRMLPDIYGEKTKTIVGGDPNSPIALATSILPTLHNLSTPEKQALLKLLRKAMSGQPQERLAVEGQVVDGDADDGATSGQEVCAFPCPK